MINHWVYSLFSTGVAVVVVVVVGLFGRCDVEWLMILTHIHEAPNEQMDKMWLKIDTSEQQY